MGKTRVCGGTCHKAKRPKCRCWRGGLFHGTAGKHAREAFVREFDVANPPTTEQAFNDECGQPSLFGDGSSGQRWRAAVAAAVAARDKAKHAPARV